MHTEERLTEGRSRERQHGVHTIEHAEKIGLGNRRYNLISIDK